MDGDLPLTRGRLSTLVELATNRCIQNVGSLQDVGSTPFHLLKPVLKKMSAKQLNQIETLSPQVMPFSDALWPALIEKEFPHRPLNPRQLTSKTSSMPNKDLYYRYNAERESLRNDSANRLRKMTEKLRKEKTKNSIVSVPQLLRDPTVKRRRNQSDSARRISSNLKKNSILLKARRELQNRSLMFPGYSQKVKRYDSYDAFKSILSPNSIDSKEQKRYPNISDVTKHIETSKTLDQASRNGVAREAKSLSILTPSQAPTDPHENKDITNSRKREREPSIFLRGRRLKRPAHPLVKKDKINENRNVRV